MVDHEVSGGRVLAGTERGVPQVRMAPLEILFQDEHLIAVSKPSGLPVHRGWSRAARTLAQLRRQYRHRAEALAVGSIILGGRRRGDAPTTPASPLHGFRSRSLM